MSNCTSCGNPLAAGAAFCENCGAPAFAPAPPAPAYFAQPQAPAWQPPAAPKSAARVFLENGLGFIPMALLLAAVFALVLLAPNFFMAVNLSNVFLQFFMVLPLAVAVAITTATLGPDFSVSFTASFCSFWAVSLINNGSLLAGLAAALLVGTLVGLVNGFFIYFLRLPSIMVTLLTGSILNAFSILLSESTAIPLEFRVAFPLLPVFAAVSLLVLAGGFVYVFFAVSQKGEAPAKPGPVNFWAYPLAGAFAALGGVMFLMRIATFAPSSNALPYTVLLLLWAALCSSKLLRNRFAPVLYVSFCFLAVTVLNNIANLLSLPSAITMLLQGFWAFLFMVPAAFVLWPPRRSFPVNIQSPFL
ncbi:MAG: zinc-ribbon domain-containing protein [Oscillospiraceae bacterium]